MVNRISVVIPHMPSVPGASEALGICVNSLQGCDELIIMVNDGIGYAKAVNQGLAVATGDYLIVANNDTAMIEGTLRDMTFIDTVTVPRITPHPRDEMPRCFFCMPRWVYEATKGYDERFEGGYFEDDDFIRRLDLLEIPVATVNRVAVHHHDGGGLTMKHIGEQENFDRNKVVYERKWERYGNS